MTKEISEVDFRKKVETQYTKEEALEIIFALDFA